MPTKLNAEIVNAAIAGFEQQKLRIDAQISELRAMLDGSAREPASTTVPTSRKRRKMSAEGRARIAAAQKARWAKVRGEFEPVKAEPAKPKRRLSAAGRRNIVAALKKRWAAKRTEAAGKSKPAATKKSAPARKKVVVKKAAVKAAPAKAAKRAPVKKVAAKTVQAAPEIANAAG